MRKIASDVDRLPRVADPRGLAAAAALALVVGLGGCLRPAQVAHPVAAPAPLAVALAQSPALERHVDVRAPPGGDGSAARPWRDLATALEALAALPEGADG